MIEKIIGNKIVLRKAKEDDLYDIFNNVWSDHELSKYMFWQNSDDLKSAKDRLNRTINYQKDSYNYFITLKESDEVIGFTGLVKINEDTLKEQGIVICKKHQNKGYGKEVLSLLIDLAFYKLNGKRFIYECVDENIVSKKLCYSYNFKYLMSYKTIREYDNKQFLINRYILNK